MKKVTGAADVTKRRGQHLLEGKHSSEEYARLVREAAAGNRPAMERLLMSAQEAAWRFSLAVCGHADDAEDAMQEALIKTYRHASQIRDPEAFRPWLYRTVRNACLMSRRRKTNEPARLESLDDRPPDGDAALSQEPRDPGRSPEEIAENKGLRRRLRRALGTLPGPYRIVVFLREMEGLSTREVASVLGITEDNVKTRLHRARLALQDALEKEPR